MHLYHFTPTTIRRLLDHAGWRIERIWHQRIAASHVASAGRAVADWGGPRSVATWLTRIAENPRFSPFVLFPFAWALAQLGISGRMTIWAQRND